MKRAMSRMRKTLILVACVALVCGLAIGGSIAWLADSTQTVTNTFTPSDVGVTLVETKNDFKMVPGKDIAKDPKVTVEAGSEDSFVFVKVTETNNVDDFLTYDIAEGWMALKSDSTVYYRTVKNTDTTRTFSVLSGDKVTVKSDVTKTDMNALTQETYPKLSFKAYVIQEAGFEGDAEKAWAQISKEEWSQTNATTGDEYGANK